MDNMTIWLGLTVLFLKTIQISLTVNFYFFGIKKNMAEHKFKKSCPKNGQKESFKLKQSQKPQNLLLMDKIKIF